MLQSQTVDVKKKNMTLAIRNMLSDLLDHELTLVNIIINPLDKKDKYNVHIVFDDNVK